MLSLPPSRQLRPGGFPSVRVQSILYNVPLEGIQRSLVYLNNAARVARQSGVAQQVSMVYGDCSPCRTLDLETLTDLRSRFQSLSSIEYLYFGDNLGHGGGQNRVFEAELSDYILIMNPDVVAAPNLFEKLLGACGKPGVGIVDARQLPVEHPKYYDESTGETSWASGACSLMPAPLFESLGGFDSDAFFLYCDDVDLSWRIKLAGYKACLEQSAVVYHDKRLNSKGGWIAGAAERYFSAEAGLLLPYKYSRSDLTNAYLEAFKRSEDEMLLKAASNFELRKKSGRLPVPIDPDHAVGQFIDGAYAKHRFQAG